MNELDREIRDPIELMDEIESVLGIKCSPVTWPIGCGRDFKGVYHLLEDRYYLYQQGHGSELIADKTIDGLNNPEADATLGDDAANLRDMLELVQGASHTFGVACACAFFVGLVAVTLIERFVVMGKDDDDAETDIPATKG